MTVVLTIQCMVQNKKLTNLYKFCIIKLSISPGNKFNHLMGSICTCSVSVSASACEMYSFCLEIEIIESKNQ